MMTLLTPKFLDAETVANVVEATVSAILFSRFFQNRFSRQMGHIVVLVPATEDGREDSYSKWPNYPIQPFCICERHFGERSEWPHPFDDIARCKAQQLWRGQNTDGNTDAMPHLLFPDDTPFWGGVKRHGLVVACSGVQPYFDQMISGMIADALKAVGRHNHETSLDKQEGRSFLS